MVKGVMMMRMMVKVILGFGAQEMTLIILKNVLLTT